MSGGRLVVLDRGGREVKRYPLASGLATLGSNPRCDIRVMQPEVSAHHATVVVHANQTVIRNVGDGETLVEGRCVSVAALRHGDLITVGDRSLRWEYAEPARPRSRGPEPALFVRGRKNRTPRRASAGAAMSGSGSGRSASLQLALEMQHRASMPGNAGGKQVAIVQPQRRDTSEQNVIASPRSTTQNKRQRGSMLEEVETPVESNRKSPAARQSPKTPALATTKAEMWIESRKTSPRKAFKSLIPRAGSSRRAPPLRTAVLKKVHSAHNVNLTKIAAPLKIDHTKQAAIMLMAGHTPKAKLSNSKQASTKKSPSLVIKKPSPVRKMPKGRKSSVKSTPKGSATRSATPRSATRASATPGGSAAINESATPTSATLNVSATTRRSATSRSIATHSVSATARGSATPNVSATTRGSATTIVSSKTRGGATPNVRASTRESATLSVSATTSISATPSVSSKTRGSATPKVRASTRGSATASFSATNRGSATTSVSFKTRGSATPNVRASTRGSATPKGGATPRDIATPKYNVTLGTISSSRKSSRGSGGQSVTILEISDSTGRESSRRSRLSSRTSPLLPSPKKSALKDPSAKASRKNESIKFDLSNLENYDNSEDNRPHETSEDDITLRYSDTSSINSPSPRKSIHSRSSRMLEKSLGESSDISRSSVASQSRSSLQRSTRSTLTGKTPDSSLRKSSRGSLIIQKALENSGNDRYSRRSTKTLTDHSDATVASAFRTRTLSPQSPEQNLETYSIVDLVSMDSNESYRSGSVYNSANSSAVAFGTPQNIVGRKTRSTIDPSLVESSTPYVGRVGRKSRSQSNPDQSRKSSIKNASQSSNRSSDSSRRSKSLTTPDSKHISVNSTRVSRASRTKSRLNDTDLLLISDITQTEVESPRSTKENRSSKSVLQESKRKSSNQSSPILPRKSSRKSGGDNSPIHDEGLNTPENRHSPEEVGTPVLSIQSLLDSSQSSFSSQHSLKKGRVSVNVKRKTIGTLRSAPKGRAGAKSKSLSFTARRGLLRLSKDSDDVSQGQEKMVTPKSGVKLVQEAVKNKHSTAKKPQSKRSIIDNLDESDIVKHLFNSPVKRKLSQSMTEFSRKQLFDDDDAAAVRRPTRNTIALTGKTPDNSILEQTEAYTPERFVSPISTPSDSPNLSGIKRLFKKNTPENDLRNIKGVKSLLRTPRTRRSIKNDLTNVSGVKKVFGRSPKNRLSDVRVKEVFAKSPKDDLSQVSGVKSLFQSRKKVKSPKNDLSDVRGVKSLFKSKSPVNDLRRVSGVKRALQKGSPRNNLSDVRGVKRMFGEEKRRDDLNDVSGVEELFNESDISVRDSNSLFDKLLGKPTIRAVYSKSLVKKASQKSKARYAKSLHSSIDKITANVEDWLERELQKRFVDNKQESRNVTVSRELQNLTTATVEGADPIRSSRSRITIQEGSIGKMYSEESLPIKKRSLVLEAGSLGVKLPLKKRVVVHSTPVKGRRGLIEDMSLGRVSPIAPAIVPLSSDQLDTEPQPLPTPKTKGRRTTKAKTETEPPQEKIPSPRKTRATKHSPPKQRSTRARKTEISQSNAKKSRPSLVLTKKSPVPSPKPRTRRGRGNAQPAAKVEAPKTARTQKQPEVKEVPKPKKTRGGKSEVAEKSIPKEVKQTPKRTRAKPQKVTVVVTKPSPKIKPAKEEAVPQRKTRKAATKNVESTKHRVETPKKPLKTGRTKVTKTEKTQEVIVTETKRGRSRVTQLEPKAKAEKTEAKGRSRSRKKAEQQESVSSEPKTRGRRTAAKANTVQPVPEVNTRKRKTAAEEVIPTKISKTKTVKGKVVDSVKTESATSVRQKRSVVKSKVEISESDSGNTRVVRSKKVVVTAVVTKQTEPKAMRSKKTAEQTEVVPKNTRKRKTEPSPVEEAAKKSPVRKTRRAASPAAARAHTDVTTKNTGRSRRR